MSLAKDIIRIVNQRDRLRIENESLLRDIKARRKIEAEMIEFGTQTYDPNFFVSYRRWSDRRGLSRAMERASRPKGDA